MWKKCKVIPLVATNDNKPALFKSELGYTKEYPTAGRMLPATIIHLYILSDDEIKVDDWYLGFDNYPNDKWTLYNCVTKPNGNPHRKIIASTDPSLNIARPSDDFIKVYCKKGGIDEVMVEFEEYRGNNAMLNEIAFHGASPGQRVNWTDPYPVDYRIKVNSDNTINIKMVKDSWNREEVEILIKRLNFFYDDYYNKCNSLIPKEVLQKWIKDNL